MTQTNHNQTRNQQTTMKFVLPAFVALSAVGCNGYVNAFGTRKPVTSASSSTTIATILYSTTTDDAFTAFADSLGEDPPKKNDKFKSLEKSWQAKLEELLDPKTDLAERQILLSELMNSNEAIQKSVMDAMANRNIDPLLTPTQKKLQDGTRAVVRQIANDILPQLRKAPAPFPPSPATLEKAGNRFFELISNQFQKNFEDLQEDLSDPINRIPQRLTKQTRDLAQEARNIFLETPEGLKEPSYRVVESCDLYEIRDYEQYTVASTDMDDGEDLATTGNAFNTLAGYLFGGNKESKSMTMTTPVATTSLGEMRFFLAEKNVPEPLENKEARVEISEVPAARLAVRKFTGFVTDGEIARQKDTLLQALEMDGIELDVPHGSVVPHVVFQYNPPYTLPIVRRNEIAVPVRRLEDQSVTSLKKEWNVDYDDDDGLSVWSSGDDDVSPSD